MPRPVVGSFAEDLYAALEPVSYADPTTGWPLLLFCGALGTLMQKVEDYVRDSPNGPGWTQLMDIDRVPREAIPYLAQYVGVQIPSSGLTEQQERDRTKGVGGWNRGTPAALIEQIKPHLTGAQRVLLRERSDPANSGDRPYHFTVVTYTSQTPDPAAVVAAIADRHTGKPAGLQFTHLVLTGQEWRSIYENYATWRGVMDNFPTWRDVAENPAGI